VSVNARKRVLEYTGASPHASYPKCGPCVEAELAHRRAEGRASMRRLAVLSGLVVAYLLVIWRFAALGWL
jgi:hypothetical protein